MWSKVPSMSGARASRAASWAASEPDHSWGVPTAMPNGSTRSHSWRWCAAVSSGQSARSGCPPRSWLGSFQP